MKIISNTFFVVTLIFLTACAQQEEKWTSLIDQNLSQWNTYLSYRFDTDYQGEPPLDSLGNPLTPIGENNDEFGVFSIVFEDGQPVLRVSGEIYGAVTSKEEYKNYHLRMKVKWGSQKWPPREHRLKDSGILYHASGPHGRSYWRTWMRSQEFQIMEGHMGDYWLTETAIDIRAFPSEAIMSQVADTSQPFIPVGVGEKNPGYCMRSANFEKPSGEWNTLELLCFEGKSLHIVNGEVVMVLRNSRYIESERKIPLTKGKIQLQSEGAEIFFKEIEIREIKSLPEKYAKLYL